MGRQVTVFQTIMHQPRPMTCALHHSATESWIFKTSRDDKNSNESSCSSWTITLLFNVINCIRYERATFDKSTNSILFECLFEIFHKYAMRNENSPLFVDFLLKKTMAMNVTIFFFCFTDKSNWKFNFRAFRSNGHVEHHQHHQQQQQQRCYVYFNGILMFIAN